MELHVTHEFAIGPADFWSLCFDPLFLELLFRGLGATERTVLSDVDDGRRRRRVQRFRPATPIPRFLKHLVKGVAFTETATLDRAKSAMESVFEPDMFRDRVHWRGVTTVSPLGRGERCVREFTGEIQIDAALIGRRVEAFMAREVEQAYDVGARVTREWIARKLEPAPPPLPLL